MRTTYPRQRYDWPVWRLFHGVIATFAVGIVVFVVGAFQTNATSSYWTFPPSFSSTYTLSTGFASYGVVMNAYGTIMYALTNYSGSNYRIEEYVLTTPWNLATANFLKSKNVTVTSAPKLVYLTEDGTKMFISEGGAWGIWKYTMSTPWDANTLTQTQFGQPCGNQYDYGSNFALGGTHQITYCGDGTTKSRDLTTAWDLKSGANSKSIDFGATYRPFFMSWSPTGTELLGDTPDLTGSNTDYIRQFSCTVAYDISTCSRNTSDIYDYSTTYGQGSTYNGFWASLDANYYIQVTWAHTTIVNSFAISTGTTWDYQGIFPASGTYEFERTASTSTWWGNIIYEVGRIFSDIAKYLFIPDSAELNYWTQLQTLATARAPFSYVSQIQTIFSTAPASSSAFPALSFNLEPTFGIHASISLLSTAQLNTYYTGTTKTLFQYLIIFALWLLFAMHVWHTVLTLI